MSRRTCFPGGVEPEHEYAHLLVPPYVSYTNQQWDAVSMLLLLVFWNTGLVRSALDSRAPISAVSH